MLFSPISVAVPSTVMSDFSALGSLCSAYASDSGDDEEPAGINSNMTYLNLVDWKVFLLHSGVHVNG